MAARTAPDFLARRTELARTVAARDIHDATLALTCLHTPDEDCIRASRHLNVLQKRFKTLCVLSERILNGASWETIAGQLGVTAATAKALYASPEQRWRAGDPQPWAPVLTGPDAMATVVGAAPIVIDTPAQADAVETELAAYCAQRGCTPPCTPPCTPAHTCTG
ncbi:hypothetical protein [Actinomadura violacea]|uniref:Uncharacterized protein n=1 Tax=Actinomadura violacea TaxID=2819934 RepID=A0ABS3RY38_9ACTN|nr:hypothetical protein [Actinomadura violacea]MBO2461655.1 hypothetical protein [Actinomadura violacea]